MRETEKERGDQFLGGGGGGSRYCNNAAAPSARFLHRELSCEGEKSFFSFVLEGSIFNL
ncbi:MAG: hypothetical protein ACPIOQ_39265 [Promethearchaeia archaeon]